MHWIRPLLLTLQLMGLSVVLAAVIGITLSFLISLISRRRLIGRSAAGYCLLSMIACIATPMILHAAAWEATAGKFGWLTFSQTAARTYTGLAGQYGGMVAAVWIHGLLGAALVCLATWFGTTRISPDVLDQGRLDGGPFWTWWRVRLPIASPWVICGLLATAILAATEMTVVDLYGVRTLADEFYLFHAAQPSITSILMFLVVPCVLAIALVIVSAVSLRRRFDVSLLGSFAPDSGDAAEEIATFPRVLSTALAVIVSTFMFAFPLVGLVLKTGQRIAVVDGEATIDWSLVHVWNVLISAPGEYRSEYQWTVVLACSTALVCVPLGWALASFARSRPFWRRTIDLLSLILFLIPGPIVGLMVVRLFTLAELFEPTIDSAKPYSDAVDAGGVSAAGGISGPISGLHFLYHQTLVPTIMALMFRALPVSYWVMRTGYQGIESSVLDVSRLDFGWFRAMWVVDRPLLGRALVIAGVASAVMASGDVPVTLPVLPPGVVTVGTRLFALLHSGARNQEAALAFWYVGSIVVVGIALACRWKLVRR